MMWRLQKENGLWCWAGETGQQRLLWLLFPASFHIADKQQNFRPATNRYSFSSMAYSHILPLMTNENFASAPRAIVLWNGSGFQKCKHQQLFILWRNPYFFNFIIPPVAFFWIDLVGASQYFPLATERIDPLVILDISVSFYMCSLLHLCVLTFLIHNIKKSPWMRLFVNTRGRVPVTHKQLSVAKRTDAVTHGTNSPMSDS